MQKPCIPLAFTSTTAHLVKLSLPNHAVVYPLFSRGTIWGLSPNEGWHCQSLWRVFCPDFCHRPCQSWSELDCPVGVSSIMGFHVLFSPTNVILSNLNSPIVHHVTTASQAPYVVNPRHQFLDSNANKEASRLYAELCEPMLKFFIVVSRNDLDC